MDVLKAREMAEELRGAVALCHHFLRERLEPGDRAIDATCGNGKDTLLLARLTGPTGRVWAFDIQAEALARTRQLLATAAETARVSLHEMGHEHLGEIVDQPVQAVIFNLGYLPGGEMSVVTRPASTVAALGQAAELLAPRGLILVAIYTGHEGAKEEEEAVLQWAAGLSPASYHVWRQQQLNRPPTAPYLLLVEKSRAAQ